MKILAIESSCDDTSVALLEATDEKITILAEKTASQIEVHKKYGGVVPEIAGREHAENIMPVVEEVMEKQEKPDVIAVTSGPGLITGLIVGVEVAKALSYLWDVPVVSVNHIEGHIHSPVLNNSQVSLKNITLPAICLTVSGGHTEIVHIKKWGEYKRIGGTRDDAAGETFDKVAKMLGLEYPGGPKISKLALTGNTKAIHFPRPMVNKDTYDFSFAGLKNSALYWLRDNKLKKKNTFLSQIFFPKRITINDFCASLEQAIIDVLTEKTFKVAEDLKPKTIMLVGGVSANKKLRETLQKRAEENSMQFITPNIQYSMDNAAMIGAAAYAKAKKKEFTKWEELEANPNWHITG